MESKELIIQWVEIFNTGDAIKLAELYHENAVNHQVANEPVKGRKAIQEMFRKEFAMAEMLCIVVNYFEDGQWCILEWKDPNGLRGCGFFKVIDGKIILQRGYWDKLSFLRLHNLPLPTE